MTNTKSKSKQKIPYVQILFHKGFDQVDLEELIQLEREIIMIMKNPPKPESGYNNHDVWKFTNRDVYEDEWLRIYVDHNEIKEDGSREKGFRYTAEIRGSESPSDHSTTMLARKWYASKNLK